MMHDRTTDSVESAIEAMVASGFSGFWNRFGRPPDFAGKNVLEIGCGLGALSIEMAKAGASRVVGIDVRAQDIDAARNYVKDRLPEIHARCEFTTSPVSELEPESYDLVVSKDAFEHIIDAQGMLREIARVLDPDGSAYIGFSPLYHSPFGDHDRRLTAFRSLGPPGRLIAAIPWGHLFLEPWIIRRHRKIQQHDVRSMHDLNLNMMSIDDFRRFIAAAGLTPRSFGANRGESKLGRLLSPFRNVRWLEKYVTYNVYCELAKP